MGFPMNNHLIWKCNLNVVDVESLSGRIRSEFWKVVLLSWAKYNFCNPTDVEEIKEEIFIIMV